MRHYISTTLASTLASRTKVLIFAAAAAGAIGIFVVPWFVPLRQPVASISYTYGFNNFVAWLAVAALLGALSLILLLRRNTLGRAHSNADCPKYFLTEAQAAIPGVYSRHS